MKQFFYELTDRSLNSANRAPLHFASYYHLDQQITRNRQFDGFSSSPEAEKEYQEIQNKKRQASLIEITSEDLKKEYLKKLNVVNNGLNSIFILSILYLIDSFINQNNLGLSGLNLTILIFSCISIGIIIILFINIKTNVLIDSYGYVIYYFFSILESIILFSLFFLKIINFILKFKKLNSSYSCPNKFKKCPSYFTYLLTLVFSFIIFVGTFMCFKFMFLLFSESLNILIKNKKTFFQRQIEINEKREKSGTIEFDDENDNNNNSISGLNSKDNLKLK